jgi:hypothetical protein
MMIGIEADRNEVKNVCFNWRSICALVECIARTLTLFHLQGISDIELSPPSDDGERTLSFSTMYLTALAILQCRWACFPFQVIIYPSGLHAYTITSF